MSEQLMLVRQLPVIEENLHRAKAAIEERVERALSLACTPETVLAVKKVRAELNKELFAFEAERKQIKKQVMAPYEAFEAVYKACVFMPYQHADETLKAQIDAIEADIRDEKRRETERYFDEYVAAAADLLPVPLAEFALFERMGLKCNKTESLKSLKERVRAYVDAVVSDVHAILSMEHADEILYEYKKGTSLAEAVRIVSERQAQLGQMKLDADQAADAAEPQPTAGNVPKPLAAPTPAGDSAKLYEARFTLLGTIEDLKSVKEFLEKRGIQYECE